MDGMQVALLRVLINRVYELARAIEEWGPKRVVLPSSRESINLDEVATAWTGTRRNVFVIWAGVGPDKPNVTEYINEDAQKLAEILGLEFGDSEVNKPL